MTTAPELWARIALPLAILFAVAAHAGDETTKKPAPPGPDAKVVRVLRGAVERAATAEKEESRAKALAQVREAPRLERVAALLDSLGHGRAAVRTLAAKELAAAKERGAAAALVRAAVHEDEKKVRVELFRAIRAILGEEGATRSSAGLLFAAHLVESDPVYRLRALVGAGAFKDRRAVPRLVEHLKLILAGFGQAAVTLTTERALIADWELVSGGSGQLIVEVPDPIIDTVRTGVAMEVKVRHVEINYTVAALQSITGEEYGADLPAWSAYLARTDHAR